MNRDFVRSTSEKFLLGFFSIIIFASCDNGEVKNSNPTIQVSHHEKDNFLIGPWEAEWKTQSESSYPGEGKSSLTMRGNIYFKEDGIVRIQAYGYQGCVFMSDTMTNELQYVVNGDTVNLLPDNESFGLPYQILESSENMVRLVLMEDISLTLTR